jgi:excisionase family DNA binding protein
MSLIDIQRRLLTIDEVAARLGVTRRTVERKIQRGEIPALQLGGPRTAIRIRVPADELERWLDSEPPGDGNPERCHPNT